MNLLNAYLEKLREAISIQSISTDPAYKPEIERMAYWCKSELDEIGFETESIEGYGNPVIFGNYIVDKKLPTVIHYGHYDVQPAQMEDGWNSEPFKLKEIGNRFFGRGIVDNKGQFISYLTSIAQLVKEGQLGYNIKFIIEGNEETGSGKLAEFISDYKSNAKADFALISDGEQINEQPTFDVSYRGTINAEIKLYGPKNDLHSGLYGGIVVNPINAINILISNITNEFGEASFLENSENQITNDDLENLSNNKFDFKGFTDITGFEKPRFSTPKELYTNLGFSNTVQLTGIEGGYTGIGFRNAIPREAKAKINIRFSPHYNPTDIIERLEKVIKENVQKDLQFEIKVKDQAFGVKIDTNNKYHKKADLLLKDIYKSDVLYNYCGATLPVAYDLSVGLDIPSVFVGLGNADCNMHGVNENFRKDLIVKALDFSYNFLRK